MKKIILIIAVLLPMASFAQNSKWERPTETVAPAKDVKAEKAAEKEKQQKADEKYLRGAAPIIDGYVQWNLDLDIPNKSASDIYDAVYQYLKALTSGDNQLEGSQIALVNKEERGIVATVKEWIDFKKTALSWDRVKVFYAISVTANDGKLHMNISRIRFDYTENTPGKNGLFTAEEWISDENALSKKGKMYRGTAKFRRKMIDRKDQIFAEVKALF